MILSHLWGLHTNPQQEWQLIDAKKQELIYVISHILLISLVPAICCYFSAVYLGWYVNADEIITLAPKVALLTALSMYCLLVGSVFLLASLAYKMAGFCHAKTTFSQSFELASYAATPLLICGFAALYPQIWFMTLVGSCGLLYSIYLLFSGVPILIHVSEDKRRVYTYALLCSGLLLLFGLGSAILYIWIQQ